jgi:hypothetical protein
MNQQRAYIPFDSLEQAKQDSKIFYKLLEKHFALKKSSISYKYDIYAKYFGYKGFSDAKNKAKLFTDKEYLPPCFDTPTMGIGNSELNFNNTMNFITNIIEDNKTDLTPNESIMNLHKGGFYESLQREISVTSKYEYVEAKIKNFSFKSNCNSKKTEKHYYFVYVNPDTFANIHVELTKKAMQNFHDELLRIREYNKDKDILEGVISPIENYVRHGRTNKTLPLYRIPEGDNIRVHCKSVIGCLHNKADYMMTYMLRFDDEPIFFDLFFIESQIDEMLSGMKIHLK